MKVIRKGPRPKHDLAVLEELFYASGLSVAEISRRLGQTRRAVELRLRRDPRYLAEQRRRAREGNPKAMGKSARGTFGLPGDRARRMNVA